MKSETKPADVHTSSQEVQATQEKDSTLTINAKSLERKKDEVAGHTEPKTQVTPEASVKKEAEGEQALVLPGPHQVGVTSS